MVPFYKSLNTSSLVSQYFNTFCSRALSEQSPSHSLMCATKMGTKGERTSVTNFSTCGKCEFKLEVMADEACMSPSWTEARLQSSPRVSVIPCYRSWVGWPAQHSTELPDTQRQFCVEMILVADVRAECGSFLPQSVVLISLLYTGHNEATAPHSGTGHSGHHWQTEGPFAGQLLLSSPPLACIHPEWDYGLHIIISKLSTPFESSLCLFLVYSTIVDLFVTVCLSRKSSCKNRVWTLSWIKQKRPESL